MRCRRLVIVASVSLWFRLCVVHPPFSVSRSTHETMNRTESNEENKVNYFPPLRSQIPLLLLCVCVCNVCVYFRFGKGDNVSGTDDGFRTKGCIHFVRSNDVIWIRYSFWTLIESNRQWKSFVVRLKLIKMHARKLDWIILDNLLCRLSTECTTEDENKRIPTATTAKNWWAPDSTIPITLAVNMNEIQHVRKNIVLFFRSVCVCVRAQAENKWMHLQCVYSSVSVQCECLTPALFFFRFAVYDDWGLFFLFQKYIFFSFFSLTLFLVSVRLLSLRWLL